jgi:hypothetical protein
VPLRALLNRIPLTLRALVLVPLLAAAVDQARVSLICPPGARSCLESAGQGRFGTAALLLMLTYTGAIGILVARLARGRRSSPTLWIVATAGLWAACGGQAMLGSELGAGAAVLGGGWTEALVLGAVAGALLAFALKAVPAARDLLLALRPSAPRLVEVVELVLHGFPPAADPSLTRFACFTRDRAPPAPA